MSRGRLRLAGRACALLALAPGLPLAAGCDIVRGPSPLNDAPVIERIDDYVFTDERGNVVQTRAFVDLDVNEERALAIEAYEPEGEELRVVVGPVPRGWRYDEGDRVLRAAPDHRQRDLVFVVYVVAEDSHDPPAYDVRVLEFNVQ